MLLWHASAISGRVHFLSRLIFAPIADYTSVTQHGSWFGRMVWEIVFIVVEQSGNCISLYSRGVGWPFPYGGGGNSDLQNPNPLPGLAPPPKFSGRLRRPEFFYLLVEKTIPVLFLRACGGSTHLKTIPPPPNETKDHYDGNEVLPDIPIIQPRHGTLYQYYM